MNSSLNQCELSICIVIELPDSTIAKLTEMSSRRNVPRAILIREALDLYIHADDMKNSAEAFGAWKNNIDGLAYQRKMRSEW
jgi:predicted transcriptional regulator